MSAQIFPIYVIAMFLNTMCAYYIVLVRGRLGAPSGAKLEHSVEEHVCCTIYTSFINSTCAWLGLLMIFFNMHIFE